MSQTLYEEAIAEARRLTEMAEQNAKNKIIEAVTPQIRMLIERELMGDDELDDEDDEEDEDGEEYEDAGEMPATIDLDALAPAPVPTLASPSNSASASSPTVKMTDGSVEVSVGDVSVKIDPSGSGTGEEILLDQPMAESIARIIAGRSSNRALNERINKLRIKVALLKEAVSESRAIGTLDQKRAVAKIFESLAREAVILQNQVILTQENTGGRTLGTKIVSSIIKEMKDMSRRNNQNVFDFLFEAEEGGEGMDTTADADDADSTVSDAVEDAVESFLDSLKAAGINVPGSEEAEKPAEGGEDKADEVSEADESYNESYPSENAMTEPDEDDKVAHDDKGGEAGHKDEVDEIYEIDESALRAELLRLRGLNEGDAVDGSGASSFGGGKAGDDMFVDVDEESLLNALADELGTAKMPKVGKMKESTETAALRRQVQDYKNVAEQLKKQLVEMNLFNAKLLYANKLMQNREITAKQQRAIVEALDNAKTLREAKLLYKSLTTSLEKAANRGNLAEGRDLRTLGSASKSARSAQPTPAAINESGSVDRWALLAGIKKD